jgi:hypothetical protein
MITGLIGGCSTLGWAIFLFIVIIYVVSLMFHEFFGRIPKENIYPFFNSVPRSMFTVFRCAFGDCSTTGGMPIFEWVHDPATGYGGFYSMIYCIFVFIVGIGLFNVISAIFVESTMTAALQGELNKKTERLQNEKLWATRVTTLILTLMEYSGKGDAVDFTKFDSDNNGQLDDKEREMYRRGLQALIDEEVKPDVFDLWVVDPRVARALLDLDINPDDNAHLFDILDCDNTGDLFVSEVIDGLQRLRGEPRRSDIITIDLMVRSIQDQCKSLIESMEKVTSRL